LTFPMSQVIEELEFLQLWTAFIWMQCLNKQNSIWHTHYISARFYSLWDITYLKACITHEVTLIPVHYSSSDIKAASEPS
jgi:hypothetical protein